MSGGYVRPYVQQFRQARDEFGSGIFGHARVGSRRDEWIRRRAAVPSANSPYYVVRTAPVPDDPTLTVCDQVVWTGSYWSTESWDFKKPVGKPACIITLHPLHHACTDRYAPKRRLHVRACICVGACMTKKKTGPFSYENRLQGPLGGCRQQRALFFWPPCISLGSYSHRRAASPTLASFIIAVRTAQFTRSSTFCVRVA
ncbi:hypothetical protein EDB80DRAFT_432736 [Ilyonectria destructans]|nr:hypothetical protein EDB80DRAFT_432736 [Ilyonectria destructans]